MIALSPSQIVVLGMHRSGTSAVTRLLHFLGCYGGPQDRFPIPDEANPKGYWENSDMVILDDALLAASGASWSEIAGLDLSRVPEQEQRAFQERAREIVEELAPWGPWVLKDPRLCLLFPWWREILERPVCVLVWRDPLPVARSLEKRHGLPLLVGIALWEAYTRAALAHSLGLPRVLVSYHELMAAPGAVLDRLREELAGFGVEGLRIPDESEIRGFLDPALNRNPRDAEAQRSYLTAPQLDLLAALESGGALALDPVPPVSAGARETLACYQRTLAEERALRSRLAQKDDEIAERDGAIAGLQAELAEQIQNDAERQACLSAELDRIQSGAEELDSLLAAVFASRSWRIGHAVSRLFRRLFPSGDLTAFERWKRLRTREETPAKVRERGEAPTSDPRLPPERRAAAPSAR
jgi:hypothetical protein